MSATLQPRWLKTVDRDELAEASLSIPAAERAGGLFDVRKPLVRDPESQGAEGIAACVRARHAAGTLTLVVVNRVTTALDVYDALAAAYTDGKGTKKERRSNAPEVELVHSRFRGVERVRWADRFLRRDAPLPDAGRIIVATQVIEAGVDISARTLVTELAPWSSLVQRFGRVARYDGESGCVVVVGSVPADAKAGAPYSVCELASADEGIGRLLAKEADGSPRTLEARSTMSSQGAAEVAPPKM
jgi:CRISPR-associated endonuclease/helicase Cas3